MLTSLKIYQGTVLFPEMAELCQSMGTQPEAGSGTGRFSPSCYISLLQTANIVEPAAPEVRARVRAVESAKGATMKLHSNERGQMLIMTAVELVLLIGFLALATDVGVLFHSKRHMQIAADAAATAAALNYYNAGLGYGATNTTDAQAADDAASANGYTNGQDGVQVTLNEPPASGYHKTPGYMEVVISKPDPLYFFKVFTGNSTATVAARAVAGDPVGAQGCIYTNQLALKGSNNISGPNLTSACGIYVSGSGTSVNNQDNGTTVYADFVDTPGTYGGKQTQPTPTTTIPSQYLPTPPFGNVYMPQITDLGVNSAGGTSICSAGTPQTPTSPAVPGNIYSSATYNTGQSTDAPLPQPATFTFGSVTIGNVYCFSQNVTIGANSQSVTNMPDGFYVFENGANVNGQVSFGFYYNGGYQSSCYDASQNGNVTNASIGAVIYNAGGTFSVSNGQLGVCSPDAGEYNALAIVQPYWNSNALNLQFGMSGNAATSCSLSGAALNGYIYAPSADVTMQDQGGGLMVTGVVANSIGTYSGPGSGANSNIIVCNYNSVNNSTTPLRQIALVE